MITLDPALDKLRSKELSFGCVLEITEPYYNGHITLEVGDNVLYAGFENKYGTVIKIEKVADCPQWLIKYKIIGHPLTRGRIQLLMVGMEATLTERIILNGAGIEEVEIVGGLYRIFKENTLYDQDELQRQQHEKRPELRKLLVKFAEYI